MHTGLVLYTDGGTHNSNPGPYGYGIHGYKYHLEKPKKGIGLSGYVPTSLGYMKKESEIINFTDINKIDYTIPYFVTIDEIINIHGSNSGISTNNVAELLGMISALQYLIENKDNIEYTVIYCDSEYVVKGINERLDNWVKNHYRKSDNEEISNKDQWVILHDLLQTLKENNVLFKIEWIKGHDKHPGNDNADLLATIAANKSSQVNKGYIENSQYLNPFKEDYFQDKLEIHPFLSSKRFYFNPYSHDKSKDLYYLSELGDKGEDIHIGKEISDASLSVVKINELDPILEMIIDIQKEWLNRHNYNLDCIVTGALDILSQKSTYNDLSRFKDDIIKTPERIRPDLFLLTVDRPITIVLDPPYLAMRTLDQFNLLEQRAKQFIEGTWNHQAIDITDYFYENKKDKKELKSDISSTLKSVDITIDQQGDTRKITLTLGIDLPKRNTLKRLETLNPTVHLLVWKIDESLYGYATVIKTKDNEWGIWMASYSGNYLV